MTAVAPADWVSTVRRAQADGFDFFDWLGCVDEIGRRDTFRIVLMLRSLDKPGGEVLTLTTEVPRDDARLDSLGAVFAGAGWHEREAAELFGVEFIGGQHRRLLLDPGFQGTPLRKDEVLAARAALDWPGRKEPGENDAAPGRRRTAAPGVPDPAIWGERDPSLPTADPAEIAASVVGGRVRRRAR